MNTDWRDDEEVQQAARNLFVGVVPERREELEGFWEQYDLRFNVLEDLTEDGSFILDAGQYRNIRFNHRAMRAFWLAGFIAWEGYQSIHSYLTTGTKDFERFSEMIDVFYCILREDDSALVPMPKGIPDPGNYVELVEHRAAAELSTLAVGWALLHEVRHIRHQREGTSAAEMHRHMQNMLRSCPVMNLRRVHVGAGSRVCVRTRKGPRISPAQAGTWHLFRLFALTLIRLELATGVIVPHCNHW